VAGIDYFNDPAAPKANSLAPSVTAIVPNEGGELLLVHQTDPQAAVGSARSPPAPAAGREQRPGAPDHRTDTGAVPPRCAGPRSWVGRPSRGHVGDGERIHDFVCPRPGRRPAPRPSRAPRPHSVPRTGRPRVRSAVLPAPLPTPPGSWRDDAVRA
jgi:hypothetical protein